MDELRLTANPARRLFALGLLWGLGGLLLALVLARPFAPGWAVMLSIMGGTTLILAEAMRRATGRVLVLDAAGLREDSGQEIAAWSAIARVERGMLALKPSGGITLVLHRAGRLAWAPGMWWRIGRRVGLGGVLRRHQMRALGDALQVGLVGRAGDGPLSRFGS